MQLFRRFHRLPWQLLVWLYRTDADGDGIGDTIKTFTSGQDNYPLVDDCILNWLDHSAPLKVTKELTPGSPIGGVPTTEITFTITVSNNGKIPLNVILHDALPIGLDYVSDTSGITPAQIDNKFNWLLGIIEPGDSKSFFLVTRINGRAYGIQENSIEATATLLEGYDTSSTANIRVTANIAVDAGPDQTICSGGQTQIGGEAEEHGFSYSWTPTANLNNPALAQPTASPAVTTTYKLTKTQIAAGLFATDEVTVTVNANHSASISPDPAAVCTGHGLQLNGNPSGGSGTYAAHEWTGTGAAYLSAADVADPVFSATTSGSYDLTYTVTDSNGCKGSDEITVIVNANPSASISPDPASVCAGQGLQLKGNPSGGSGVYADHEWTGAGAAYLSAANVADPVLNAPTAGSYDLTYTVTDSNGCIGSDAISVTVNANPIASASSNSPVCVGGTIALLGGPSGMSSYSWTGPNGFSSSLPNPTLTGATASMAGIYTLKVESPDGCSNEASTEVVVSSPPLNPSQPSGPSSARRGSSYSFTTSTTDPNSDQMKYAFNWGDGKTDDTVYVASGDPVSLSLTWSSSGIFTVRAKAIDDKGCDSGWSPSKMVSVTWFSPGNQSQADAELANGSEVQSLISIEDQAEIPPGQKPPEALHESAEVKPRAVYPG